MPNPNPAALVEWLKQESDNHCCSERGVRLAEAASWLKNQAAEIAELKNENGRLRMENAAMYEKCKEPRDD